MYISSLLLNYPPQNPIYLGFRTCQRFKIRFRWKSRWVMIVFSSFAPLESIFIQSFWELSSCFFLLSKHRSLLPPIYLHTHQSKTNKTMTHIYISWFHGKTFLHYLGSYHRIVPTHIPKFPSYYDVSHAVYKI